MSGGNCSAIMTQCATTRHGVLTSLIMKTLVLAIVAALLVSCAPDLKREAAEQGDARAQNNLSDLDDSIRALIRKAQQGNADAQYNLGNMYRLGQGVPKDFTKAVYWLRKAAGQGYANAQYNLGNMYRLGQGVLKDFTKAVYWWRKAAGQGDADAQFGLGVMYGNGQGVLKNAVLAHMWYNIASANGDEDAGKYRDELERRMSKADIARATALAQRCMKSKYKTCG